jgi:hypothetical protein
MLNGDDTKSLFFSAHNIEGLSFWCHGAALEATMNRVYVEFVITKEQSLGPIELLRAMNTAVISACTACRADRSACDGSLVKPSAWWCR